MPNEATPGPNPDGSYITPNANFERDAAIFDVVDVTGMYLWSFGGDLFPGIPGSGGHTTKFALEAVTFLELPAGPTTFGVSVATEQTRASPFRGRTKSRVSFSNRHRHCPPPRGARSQE